MANLVLATLASDAVPMMAYGTEFANGAATSGMFGSAVGLCGGIAAVVMSHRCQKRRRVEAVQPVHMNLDVARLCDRINMLEKHVGQLQDQNMAFRRTTEALQDAMAQKVDVGTVPTIVQYKALPNTMNLKADANAVPIIAQYEALRNAMEQKDDTMTVQALQMEIAQKADAGSVPTIEQHEALQNTMNLKADATAVPTLQQQEALAQALQDAMAQKADIGTVPTIDQYEALQNTMNLKADANAVPIIAQYEALQNAMEQKADTMNVQALQIEIAQKADAGSVPTIEQHEALQNTMNLKADTTAVPTLQQHEALAQALQDAMAQEADTGTVPTIEQYEALQNTMNLRADATAVPTLQQHEALAQALQNAMAQKADVGTVPTIEQHLALQMRAPTIDQYEVLQNIVNRKADSDDVQHLARQVQHIDRFRTLTPNLITNSFMDRVCNDMPVGYTVSYYQQGQSQIRILAVHPYTKGFEGPYWNTHAALPGRSTDDWDEATKDCPYVFGWYNKGPRAARGGLADGWGGYSDGHILKIWGSRNGDTSETQCRVKFPFEGRALTAQVLFRAYLKIVKGGASLQTDVSQQVLWNRAFTEAQPHGWLHINEVIKSSHITNIKNIHVLTFNEYGENERAMGDFEMYLALPYMANLVGGTTSSQWQCSVLDMKG